MRKRQKNIEKSLLREFLESALGLTIIRLLGRRRPRPDGYAVIEEHGRKAILEIELTEYQADVRTLEGGSPGERLSNFWRKVQESLCRRLSKNPIEVEIRVTMKDPSKVKSKDARGFAEELVRLARGFDALASEARSLTTFQPEFPLLTLYVRRLTLNKVSFYSFDWTCADASAAMVGVSPKHLTSLVRKKASKNYRCAKNAEKWLLVCASGKSIVGHAGPPPPPTTWQDPELQAVRKAAPFDRVFFWDRVRGWHESLK